MRQNPKLRKMKKAYILLQKKIKKQKENKNLILITKVLEKALKKQMRHELNEAYLEFIKSIHLFDALDKRTQKKSIFRKLKKQILENAIPVFFQFQNYKEICSRASDITQAAYSSKTQYLLTLATYHHYKNTTKSVSQDFFHKAVKKLQQFTQEPFPESIRGEANYYMGKIYFEDTNWQQAIQSFETSLQLKKTPKTLRKKLYLFYFCALVKQFLITKEHTFHKKIQNIFKRLDKHFCEKVDIYREIYSQYYLESYGKKKRNNSNKS